MQSSYSKIKLIQVMQIEQKAQNDSILLNQLGFSFRGTQNLRTNCCLLCQTNAVEQNFLSQDFLWCIQEILSVSIAPFTESSNSQLRSKSNEIIVIIKQHRLRTSCRPAVASSHEADTS